MRSTVDLDLDLDGSRMPRFVAGVGEAGAAGVGGDEAGVARPGRILAGGRWRRGGGSSGASGALERLRLARSHAPCHVLFCSLR